MSKFATPAIIGVSAVLGAAIALGAGALGVGDSGGATTTILRQAPLSTSASSGSDAPTARQIYERDAPGVVLVQARVTQTGQTSPFGLPQQQRGESTGSGFVIDADGTILTNEHVIDGATKVRVSFSNDKTVDAKIIGSDTSNDVAVLRVDPKGLDLKPLKLGSAKDVQVGDPVLAIGNPYGLDRTLTTGVVSAKQRRITAPNGFPIENVIQTDASINPGNSGGPLLDGAGRVIGINSQIATSGNGSSGSVGIGFAMPIDTIKQILPDLKKNGKANIAYLGVRTTDVPDGLPDQLKPASDKGAWVQKVIPDSPADKAGLRAGEVSINTRGGALQVGGDLIVAVDDHPVKSADDLGPLISAHKPGDTVKVEVYRGKDKKTLTVKLGRRADNEGTTAQQRQAGGTDGRESPDDGAGSPFDGNP